MTTIDQSTFDAAVAMGIPYRADCVRITEAARRTLGLTMTPTEAQVVWQWHSDSLEAGWLIAEKSSDADIANVIQHFVEAMLLQ